jgi:hypothetical protein
VRRATTVAALGAARTLAITRAANGGRLGVSVPPTALGQANLPLFSRRAASHVPMPSCTRTFMRLARRLANR